MTCTDVEIKRPMRTCLACRKKTGKEDLLRFVVQSGLLVKDGLQTAAGRGAYCCNNDTCLQKFVRNRKQLARGFRLEVSELIGDLSGVGIKNG